MINIRVNSDEAIAALDVLPRKLREAVLAKLDIKMREVVDELYSEVFVGLPNKYFDPERIKPGVDRIASSVIGYIESDDREDKYIITPVTKSFLQFIGTKDDEWVRTHLVRHPYLKSAPYVEELLSRKRAWIEEQLARVANEEQI